MAIKCGLSKWPPMPHYKSEPQSVVENSSYKLYYVCVCLFVCLFPFGATAPQWARTSSFMRFLDHTQRSTTVGRTLLNEWSARRRDLYLTTHNTHNRQTSMLPVRFEPTTLAGDRPQTYDLDRAATGTGKLYYEV